jgi:hypothetical protein
VTILELGGLRFEVSFRGPGATLRVLGKSDSDAGWAEILRFDDFIEEPHFHAPAENRMAFDRALGEPLAWYLEQISDHLAEWMERAGFATLIGSVDFEAISRNIGALEDAMVQCVPEGYARIPGVGLQRV